MSESPSYRQILRSSSIIGGASIINVLLGLLRTKVAALLLGPVGIGLLGLLQSLMTTASTVASLGFGTVGTRQIAEATGREDSDAIAAARRALFWGTLGLATVGATAVWALRYLLADHLIGDARWADAVGWLGLGVALTVAAGSQSALLNGMRRVGDIARASILSAVLTTILGIGALLLWGEKGLPAFVIAAPLGSFLLGHYFVSRLPKIQRSPTPLPQLFGQWRVLAQLGAAFMVAGLVTAAGQLAVRTLVQRELGAEALGFLQASSAISTTYIGFVLKAMGTDYYPRLTAVIHDHAATNRMINEQTEVALLLAGPVFLAMLGLAPTLIELLFSSQFVEAASVFRWQVLGDVLKVVSWPLGFVILASGDGRTFMLTESFAIAVFVCITWLGLPVFGVTAAGFAYFCMYAVYTPVVYWLAWRRTEFTWDARVFTYLILLILTAIGVWYASGFSHWVAAITGIVAAMLFGAFGLRRLNQLAGGLGPLGKIIVRLQGLFA